MGMKINPALVSVTYPKHLLVTGHGLVLVRVESGLVEVVSVSIERVDMTSIESSFAVHHREQHSKGKKLCNKLTRLGLHFLIFLFKSFRALLNPESGKFSWPLRTMIAVVFSECCAEIPQLTCRMVFFNGP